MSMSTDRAIEILDPEHREHYDGIEEVNEACRMGMAALRALKGIQWTPVSERLPDTDDEFVLAVCCGYLPTLSGARVSIVNEIMVAEYDEIHDSWSLSDLIEAQDVTVSHWMRLPPLPEGLA